jgi:hypothetical protein
MSSVFPPPWDPRWTAAMHYFLCHVDLDVPNDVWATSRPLLTVQWQVGHLPLSHLQWWKYRRYPYPRSLAPPPFTCSPVVESPPHLFGLCAPRCSLSRVFLCLCLSAPHLSSLLFYALLPKGSSLLPLLVALFITVFTGRPLLPCGAVRFVSSLFLDASFLAFFFALLRFGRFLMLLLQIFIVLLPRSNIWSFGSSYWSMAPYCVFYSGLLGSSSSSCNSVSLRCFFGFDFHWFLHGSNILRFLLMFARFLILILQFGVFTMFF